MKKLSELSTIQKNVKTLGDIRSMCCRVIRGNYRVVVAKRNSLKEVDEHVVFYPVLSKKIVSNCDLITYNHELSAVGELLQIENVKAP
jgi:hypothetical protein